MLLLCRAQLPRLSVRPLTDQCTWEVLWHVLRDMRRMLLTLVLLTSLRLTAERRDSWSPFVLRAFDGRDASAELMIIPVRENRSAPESRFVRIGVVRLPTTDLRQRGKPPIVFLSGGPGIPATTLARVPVYFDLFTKLRQLGDVLLIDQRGTGMSIPNLNCPAVDLPANFLSSDERMREVLAARVGVCARFWQSGGVDLRGYSTREIAADVNAVRNAVGAKSLRLVAFSYGSEVAFELLRRRPTIIDRVVFASTRAPDTLLKMADAWDRQLEYLGRLTGTPLPQTVKQIVNDLDQKPLDLQTSHGTMSVGGIGPLMVLRSDLPDARAFPSVAKLIHDISNADYALLAKRVEQMHASLSSSMNLMTLAVDCNSGWSSTRRAATENIARVSIMRNVNLQWHATICNAVIGRHGDPTTIRSVATPTLFITGTQDVNAPPGQTEQIRRRFARSLHVIVENGAHETLPIAAVQEEVIRFLSGKNVRSERIAIPEPLEALARQR